MANTTLGFPYVAGTAAPAGHTQVQALAEAVDASPGISSLTATEITALTVSEKRAGRVVYNETTSRLQRSNGSTWENLTIATDLSSHESDTTSVHGITDTSLLVTNDGSATLTTKTMSGASNTFSNIPQSAVTNLVTDLARDNAETIIAISVFS
jgi:hypothetical protein